MRTRIIEEARALILEAASAPRSDVEIYVFGESHFHHDEVNHIREEIKKIKPDIIIHELDWEEDELKKYFKVIPLEPSISVHNKKVSKDLKKQFFEREAEMIKTVKKYLQNGYKKIVIVVGDTHLRTTKEFFNFNEFTQFLNSIGAKIFRSKYKEIK